MKTAILSHVFFFLILFTLWPAAQKEKAELAVDTPVYFTLRIEQDDRIFSPDGERGVLLKKAPFDFVFSFDTEKMKRYAVHLHVCEKDHFYIGLSSGQKLEEILYFAHPQSGGLAAAEAFRRGAMSVAVSLFNADEEMIIHEYNHQSLFYENEDLHNFSQVIREGDNLIGRWRVSRFSDQQGNQSIPMVGLPYSTLFIAVLYVEFSAAGQPLDRQWEYFQLHFSPAGN